MFKKAEIRKIMFKSGDKVICISDEYIYLTLHKVYKVEIIGDVCGLIGIICDDNSCRGYFSERFILVNSKEGRKIKLEKLCLK